MEGFELSEQKADKCLMDRDAYNDGDLFYPDVIQ